MVTNLVFFGIPIFGQPHIFHDKISTQHIATHKWIERLPAPAEEHHGCGKATWVSVAIYPFMHNKPSTTIGCVCLLSLQVLLAPEVPRMPRQTAAGQPELVWRLQVRSVAGCCRHSLYRFHWWFNRPRRKCTWFGFGRNGGRWAYA